MAGNLSVPFIGKKVAVSDAANKSYVGIQGVIVNETKNAFVIDDGTAKKTVLKKDAVFQIDGKQIIGKKITKRIEERIKS